MRVYTLVTPGLSIHSYLVIDELSEKAFVIDPTRNVEPILEILDQNNAELLFIFETHVHADFVSGAKELKTRLKNKPKIGCSILGGETWIPKYRDLGIHDREEFHIGSLVLQAWHTPGHTPEHLMYILHSDKKPLIAFTGDFLFSGSVGRPDLFGAELQTKLAKDLYNSIFNLLPVLPNDLRILPAHGAGSLCGKDIATNKETTLGNERLNNPALQKQDQPTWTSQLLKGMPKAPAYFSLMKKINITGSALLKDLTPIHELTSEDLAALDLSDYFILDVRPQNEFAKRHLQGAINIPWATNFLRWMGEFASYKLPIIIMGNNVDLVKEAINSLHLIGLDEIAGFAIAEEKLFQKFEGHLASFPTPTVKEFFKNLALFEAIDVRTDMEWNSGHIPGAKHIEINQLNSAWKQIRKDIPIAFVCGSGYRASIASSLAQKEGIMDVCNIEGGMQAWKQAQLPLDDNISDS